MSSGAVLAVLSLRHVRYNGITEKYAKGAPLMTVTLELKPEEVTALETRANAEGIDIEAALHRLVAQLMPPPAAQKAREKPELNERQKAAIALMEAWREEDRTDDPEELAERDRELKEFKANINRWRAEEGRPPAY